MDFGKVIYYSENIDIGFVGNETESYQRVRALIAKYLWFHYRFKKKIQQQTITYSLQRYWTRSVF